MTFRSMCGSCGHTKTAETINECILEMKHERTCVCFTGAPVHFPTIDLSKIKTGNPKYFIAYEEESGFKSDDAPN